MKGFGIIAAVLSALSMGTMGVFSRKTGYDAEIITFFRLFVGSLFLGVMLLLTRRLHVLRQWPTWPVLINGLMLAGFIIFYVQAMYFTTMANAIMMLYLAPVIASVYAHFFLRERLDIAGILLIGTALFGFAMMLEFQLDLSTGSNQVVGLSYASLGLLCYTAFILVNRIITPTVHVYTRTFYQLFIGALSTAPFLLFQFHEISLTAWPWLLGVGFIPGFLGILLAVIALEQLPAATFGTLAYFEPIFVVILGWMIFNEELSLLQLSGCGLILISGIAKGWLTITSDSTLQKHKKS